MNHRYRKLATIAGVVVVLASSPPLISSAFGHDRHHAGVPRALGVDHHPAVARLRHPGYRESYANMNAPPIPAVAPWRTDPDDSGCHWVGMAGYYGVPWAYNTFLDDDNCDP